MGSQAVLTGHSNITSGTFSFNAPDTQPTVAQSGSSFSMIFTPDDIEYYNTLTQNVPVTVKDSIAPIIWGDANGDGEVDLADVLRLRRCLAGHPVVCNMPESDANGDGELDLADVLRLRRYLAGHPVTLGPPQSQQFISPDMFLADEEVKISVSNETAATGEYVDVVISLDENPEMFVLQLTLEYDEAVLEAVDITSGDLIPIPVMPLLSANPLRLNFEGSTIVGTVEPTLDEIEENNFDDIVEAVLDDTGELSFDDIVGTNFDDVVVTGTLATIRFRVLDDAAVGSTAITVDGIYSGNAIEDSFAVSTIDGSVLVEPPQTEAMLVSTIPMASVKVLNGNKNDLTITVTEAYSDGSINKIVKTFSINNNAAGSYQVGRYIVYVDTKGNDQIRQCYIVK